MEDFDRVITVVRPKAHYQGKAVVSRCGECGACQEWSLLSSSAPYCEDMFVMMPDGTVEHVPTAVAAERKVRAWFAKTARASDFNVGLIEWRQGLKPASELPTSCGGRKKLARAARLAKRGEKP